MCHACFFPSPRTHLAEKKYADAMEALESEQGTNDTKNTLRTARRAKTQEVATRVTIKTRFKGAPTNLLKNKTTPIIDKRKNIDVNELSLPM